MTRIHTTALAFLVALASASAASAAVPQPLPTAPPGLDDEDLADLAGQLGLKPDQQRAITAIQDEARKAELKLRAEIDANGIDLRRELAQPSPDEKKVGALVDKISGLEGAVRKTRVMAMLKVRKLLGPDQWARLEAMRGRVAMGQPMDAVMGKGHGHGGRHADDAMEEAAREMAKQARKMGKDIDGEVRKQIEEALREAQHARADAMREAERARAEAMRAMEQARREIEQARRDAEQARRDADQARRQGGVVVGPGTPGAKTGRLMINATPYAKVLIDGKLAGMTPLIMEMAPGKHVIELRRDGYDTRKQTVSIKAGESVKLAVTLSGGKANTGDDDDDDDDDGE